MTCFADGSPSSFASAKLASALLGATPMARAVRMRFLFVKVTACSMKGYQASVSGSASSLILVNSAEKTPILLSRSLMSCRLARSGALT